MKQTYCIPELKIVLLNYSDIVTASGMESGSDFQAGGQYDGSNEWNGF